MSLLQALLPRRVLTIQSSLPAAEIYERLRPDVTERDGPATGFSGLKVSTPYCGSVTPTEFRIMRVLSHQNGFLPVVRGRLEPIASGTMVHIDMRPLPFVAGFMLFWLGFVALITIGALIMWSPIALVGPVMFAFGVALSRVAFGAEAGKTETYLRQLLR